MMKTLSQVYGCATVLAQYGRRVPREERLAWILTGQL
jgi:hypothetical protein